jgi:sulfur-oxidizing protein SoxY
MKLTQTYAYGGVWLHSFAAMLPVRAFAALEDDIAAFTGGADVGSGYYTDRTRDLPRTAAYGANRSERTWCEANYRFRSGWPTPAVATFVNYGPLAVTSLRNAFILAMRCRHPCAYAGRYLCAGQSE